MTHRRNRKRPSDNTPEALAARLPVELQSFDSWAYWDDSNGLRDYWAALAVWINNQLGVSAERTIDTPGHHLAPEVMRAAELDPAEWFRTMLGVPTTKDPE